jgi:uncharacterized membrane-anchored protein
MSRLKWIIIFVNFLLLLVYFNCSVLNKEKILSDGKLILLELAPVDPRSLMQGDYMRLNYAITSGQSSYGDIAKTGYCVVELDSLGVGRLKRFQPDRKGLAKGEYLIEYNLNGWDMKAMQRSLKKPNMAECVLMETGTVCWSDFMTRIVS